MTSDAREDSPAFAGSAGVLPVQGIRAVFVNVEHVLRGSCLCTMGTSKQDRPRDLQHGGEGGGVVSALCVTSVVVYDLIRAPG